MKKQFGIICGADAGGTFTDFVGVNKQDNDLKVGKALSTPSDPAKAINEASKRAGIDTKNIDLLIYGTTVATNTLIERKGANVGLLSTLGFRDLIATQRITRPDHFDLHWKKTEALIPRSLRLGIEERVLANGEVDKSLNEKQAREQIQKLINKKVEAIAVAFLFSFMNPEHEKRVRDIIMEMAPNISVSISYDVLPKWGEFARTSTTVIDAYLKPILHHYIKDLNNKGIDLGIKRLQILQANGGALTATAASENPARLVKSGPAGGVISASYIGKITKQKHIIIADMGGTSFETGFIPNCEPSYSSREELEYGIPIALNTIDVRSIGAGGGSLAYLDGAGILKVGPQSSGSNPGPACYDLGGENPTITDANLVLGRMVQEFPLGGYLELKKELALKSLEKLSKEMNLSIPKVARGIIAIAVNNMAQAMRLVSIDCGHDPRDSTLIPYGGAGPLHACELAKVLQVGKVLVPRFPGAFSALGALISKPRFDYRQTYWMVFSKIDPEKANQIFDELENRVKSDFDKEGITEKPNITRSVDIRYLGQNFELEVPISNGKLDKRLFNECINSFHLEHERLYNYSLRGEECEILNLNISASLDSANFVLPKIAKTGKPEPIGYTDVFLDEDDKTKVPLFNRNELGAGTEIIGPAIIGQLDTTTLLPKNTSSIVDEFGNLEIKISGV